MEKDERETDARCLQRVADARLLAAQRRLGTLAGRLRAEHRLALLCAEPSPQDRERRRVPRRRKGRRRLTREGVLLVNVTAGTLGDVGVLACGARALAVLVDGRLAPAVAEEARTERCRAVPGGAAGRAGEGCVRERQTASTRAQLRSEGKRQGRNARLSLVLMDPARLGVVC